MNRSESKYFHTALLMDEALIALLEVKDLEYITVKEVCEKAGVNRSTFYLHYETLADLANEAMEVVNRRFQSYFEQRAAEDLVHNIDGMHLKDLVFINQDYLQPYLQFIRDNKKVYRAAFRSPGGMRVHERYKYFKSYILEPILKRFEVPEAFQKYYIAYYIEGIIAIIKVWLNDDCKEPIENMVEVIVKCVYPSGLSEPAGGPACDADASLDGKKERG